MSARTVMPHRRIYHRTQVHTLGAVDFGGLPGIQRNKASSEFTILRSPMSPCNVLGSCWSDHRAPDVRPALVFRPDPFSTRMVVGSKRVHSYLPTALGYPGMFATAPPSRAIHCCQLHLRRLLVHRVNLVCQPGSDDGQVLIGYFRRDSARRSAIT
jgi:hypothetical protein